MGTQLPPEKGHTHPTQFLAHVYRGQMAGWMKMPLGTEVDLGPRHIVLDGIPVLRERGTAASLFSAHVYCGHGRPSQLLLSSCSKFSWHILLHISTDVCISLTLTIQPVLI